MQVKFMKKHPEATMPKRAKIGDAGYDLTAVFIATEAVVIPNGIPEVISEGVVKCSSQIVGTKITIDTGIAVEIPEGYVGYLFPRGSIFKHNVEFANSVGVIDSNFRGSIKVVLNSTLTPRDLECSNTCYSKGDKIAQLIIMPIPTIDFIEVSELSETERNDQMLGSSGK